MLVINDANISRCMVIKVFQKRCFVKEKNVHPPHVTGGYLGSSYIEGEADRTSQGSPPRHLKFHNFYIVYFHQVKIYNVKMVKLQVPWGTPLDLCDQPLLLYMNFLGTPQLRRGVYVLFFFKVSFLKHPN